MSRVLVTGGAGFIGSHAVDRLLARGHEVRVLDALDPQVHPRAREGLRRQPALDPRAGLRVGDLRDAREVRAALEETDAVLHLGAAVGVGQSMYEVRRYVDVNGVGTATLLEALQERPVERLVVASSMSVYGEGLYRAPDGTPVEDAARDDAHLARRAWDPVDEAGQALRPAPTPETKRPDLRSVYALTKYDQERLCLLVGKAYGIPTTALRFFNAYGPRQTLGNPYTGVLAIFATRILNGKPPVVFEDGRQLRDFVSVHDVAEACALALEQPGAAGHVLNVGSGEARSVLDVAHALLRALGREDLQPVVEGRYRKGDVRHCYADLTRAAKVLGYAPRVRFEEGLRELVAWLREQQAEDRFDEHQRDLQARGLLA